MSKKEITYNKYIKTLIQRIGKMQCLKKEKKKIIIKYRSIKNEKKYKKGIDVMQPQ